MEPVLKAPGLSALNHVRLNRFIILLSNLYVCRYAGVLQIEADDFAAAKAAGKLAGPNESNNIQRMTKQVKL